MVGLILTMGLGGTLHARVSLGNELRGELVQRGTTAASGISSRSEEALLTNDVFALYEMINAALINDQDVHYVFITDSSGEVRAKTFPGALPSRIQSANIMNPDGTFSVRRLPSDEGDRK